MIEFDRTFTKPPSDKRSQGCIYPRTSYVLVRDSHGCMSTCPFFPSLKYSRFVVSQIYAKWAVFVPKFMRSGQFSGLNHHVYPYEPPVNSVKIMQKLGGVVVCRFCTRVVLLIIVDWAGPKVPFASIAPCICYIQDFFPIQPSPKILEG